LLEPLGFERVEDAFEECKEMLVELEGTTIGFFAE
jgi:hypothetical protein